jgi:hypothetical protein
MPIGDRNRPDPELLLIIIGYLTTWRMSILERLLDKEGLTN